MTTKLFCAFALVLTVGPFSAALAAKGKKAHEHGSARLDILAEGKGVTLSFEAPAESIVGFEHEAKTDSDKAKQAKALATLRERVAEIVLFDKALECKFMDSKAEVVREEEGAHDAKAASKKHGHGHGHGDHAAEHSEVKATFKAECAKAVAGSSAQIDFGAVFPAVRKVAVQVLSGEKQKGYSLRKKGWVEL